MTRITSDRTAEYLRNRSLAVAALSLLCLSLSPSAFAREEYSRTFDKSIPVQAGQRLILEHTLGSISIHTHASREVSVHADIKVSASDAADAKSFAENIAILVEPSSTLLNVRTRYPERPGSFFGSRQISYSVNYDVAVPDNMPLQVRNSFGSVSVAGSQAACDIKTSHGSLQFNDGRGIQRLENAFGSIQLSGNAGDVAVENTNGSVSVSGIKGALTLRDRFGSVHVSDVTKGAKIVNNNGRVELSGAGDTQVDNSFGPVAVSNVKGDLTVNNQNGPVDANNVSGSATLTNGFGPVRFSNISGQVTITNRNGPVTGRNAAGLKVQTSFGPVDVGDIRGGVAIVAGQGSVHVTNVGGETSIRNSFGLIHVENVGSLSASNANAAIKASGVRGDATVNTSFGAVLLDTVSGAVNVGNQNGAVDVTATGPSCKPIEIRSSFSTIRLRLPERASYRVNAKTSFGKITSDFPLGVSASSSQDAVSGVIGSGQCPLTISNSNGNINILK
jgi:hypothetical protein